jgi:uncharacterized membrane protein
MSAFLSTHASELWSALLGAIGGAMLSIPITIKITRNSVSSDVNTSNQRGAKSKGDIVGRDKISH